MELRLVDITPTPDPERKPGADTPTLEFPALELEPMTLTPAVVPAAAPAVAVPRAIPAPAPRTSEPPAGLQLLELAPTPGAVEPATQEIELEAVGKRRAPLPRSVDGIPTPTDPFAAEALQQYKAGNIDLPLWSRAVSRHEGDEPAAIAAYLRARATALKLNARQKRVDDPNPPARAAAVRPRAFLQDDEDRYVEPPSRADTLRRYAMFAAPIVVVLAVGVWWMVTAGDRDSAQASNPEPVPTVAGAAAAPKATPARTLRATKEDDPGTYFAGKILDLKSAGNWNVLVLFASEWTRKQPDNATAWRELSVGYTNMRQHADALDAGKRAAALAPNDSLVWRNLAQVNVDLKEPEAALKAYEKAATLNDLDVYSMLQVGLINAELNRIPQAREALERVLAADPDNPDALCATASIAQRQGRGKDADAASKQLRPGERKCKEAPAAAAPAVAVATRK